MKFQKTEIILKWFMNFVLLVILISAGCFNLSAQTDSTFSFLVAGHAYGAHSGVNIGLHPPFLKKLTENHDSVMGLFLTGDIVNQSTNASWNQVENELLALGVPSYYVMGNHDNNSVGNAVFKKKHGGTYYAFLHSKELFIILNSTESDRSISGKQLLFLDTLLHESGQEVKRIYIFFHEVIWNSNIKYKMVKSNSRSRYDQMINISNFWTEVYPRFTKLQEKKFFLFAGDVGGNTDAISAFFDKWENVTLISSGMGEVSDENYLKVTVSKDTVVFQLIPLNNSVKMHPLNWYNVPEKPGTITGPATVNHSQPQVAYKISPVFNATGYKWILSSEMSGVSDSSQIMLQFGNQFKTGKLSVSAINKGFGESEPSEMDIKSEVNTGIEINPYSTKIDVLQEQNVIKFNFQSFNAQKVPVKIYDLWGRVVFSEIFVLNQGSSSQSVQKNFPAKGLFIIVMNVDNEFITKKVLLH